MPEFEENKDAAKTAPYTYEPSQSSAAELGQLAGVVLTGGNSGNKPPTKSRWGKSPENSSQGGVDMTVPAGEIDLSNKDALKDAMIEKPPSNPSPRQARDQDSSRKDTPRQSSNDDQPEHQHRSGNRSERREGGERSGDRRGRSSERPDRREGGERPDDRRGRSSERADRREGGERPDARREHGQNRNRSGESPDPDRSAQQDSKSKEIKPVVTPIQVEPETFSDKIVNFVKMLFGSGSVETKTPKENQSSDRSSEDRQGSGRTNRRRRSGGQGRSGGQRHNRSGDNRNRPEGEASQRSGERGSNNGGRRRRRRQGGDGQGRSSEERQSDGSSES